MTLEYEYLSEPSHFWWLEPIVVISILDYNI